MISRIADEFSQNAGLDSGHFHWSGVANWKSQFMHPGAILLQTPFDCQKQAQVNWSLDRCIALHTMNYSSSNEKMVTIRRDIAPVSRFGHF
jgi:hypothetical protein